MTHLARRARRPAERGQAMVEYIVVLVFVVIVLVVATAEPAVYDQLITAAKSFFRFFSYAMSIPAQDSV